jgi:hypothetical protein
MAVFQMEKKRASFSDSKKERRTNSIYLFLFLRILVLVSVIGVSCDLLVSVARCQLFYPTPLQALLAGGL